MKKILACTLAAVSGLVMLAGCEEVDKDQYIGGESSQASAVDSESSQQAEPTELADAAWNDMMFLMDGQLFTFDFNCNEIFDAGWTYDTDVYGLTDYQIEPGIILSRTVFLNNPNYSEGILAVGFTNTTDSTVGMDDCVVWSVELSAKDANAPEIVLPGDVRFGMTLDEIKAIYGEPTEEERFEDEGYTEYRYKEDAIKGLYLDFYDDGGFCKFIYENF